MRPAPNNFVQATPVFAFLLALSQVPGAPDDNRWARDAMKYLFAILVCSVLCGCQPVTKFQPTWLSDPSRQVVYSYQDDGKVFIQVKAKVSQAEFVAATDKLKMIPLSADKDSAAHAETLRWKRGSDKRWDPLPTTDETFLCHRGDWWETAKYENGFLYYQLIEIKK